MKTKLLTLSLLLSACGSDPHISSSVTDYGKCSVIAETATVQELDCGNGILLITQSDDGVSVVFTGDSNAQ